MSLHLKMLLDRLNDHCANAFEQGAGFAAARGHYEVGIDHVVIKLLETGGGDFDRICHHFEVELDPLWHGILQSMDKMRSGNAGKPAFSILLGQWLERAWSIASLRYGLDRIRSVALLEALIELMDQWPNNPYAELAAVDRHRLRRNSHSILAGSCEVDRPEALPPENIAAPQPDTIIGKAASPAGADPLAAYTQDLTARASNDEIDPVLGRNDEIRQLIDILTRRRKNNPIVVGEAGVGKTAVVEGLALRIAASTVPDRLKGVWLLTLDLGLLQAGAGVKGEFEKRLKSVIDAVKEAPAPIILFIDEAHTMIGAGNLAGGGDAANLLKPALARGELRTVAATTWSEYKKYFERDAALARRFQLVKIEEPSEANAQIMLSGLKDFYETHHDVPITDSAVAAAVRLSHRYISGRYLPDKAIDLIDTAAARVSLAMATEPAEVTADREHAAHIERRLAHIRADQNQGFPVDDRMEAALRQDLVESRARLADTEARWQHDMEAARQRQARRAEGKHGASPLAPTALVPCEVSANVVADVVADWTGIPAGSMVRNDVDQMIQFTDTLETRIIGQTDALNAIGRSLRRSKAGLGNPEAPLGVFLLTGLSGVGKSETARAVAEHLFGGERFLVTVNLSEYQEPHSVAQLKGSPPGYVGYGEGGILTEAVRQRPYSVILLDEAEKAHPDVLNLFYQVFDRGRMRDGEGREIDFRNTVLFLTTNLGSESIRHQLTADPAMKDWQPPTPVELTDSLIPTLQQHFPPALLARMQIVPFAPLAHDTLAQIAALKLDDVAHRLHCAHGIAMRCDPAVLAGLARQCTQADTGARQVHAVIDTQLMPGIAKSLLEFMADDAMPDILALDQNDAGEITCTFADICNEEEIDTDTRQQA